ncbi:MAG TPA: hypothetical protein VF170_07410, partial [Planctomycetaceae bacterium]
CGGGVAAVLITCVGCGGDPTDSFKGHVSKISDGLVPALQASELGKDGAINKAGDVAFDVQKTDSTVSPYAAVLSFKTLKNIKSSDIPIVMEWDWKVNYAYQDDAWSLKDYSITTSNIVTDKQYAALFQRFLGQKMTINESKAENAQLLSLLKIE